MKIFVNARFLTQPVSGVQRYGIECSRQIKKLYPDVVFISPANVIYKDLASELEVKIIGRNTGHLWEQLDLPFFMVRQKNAPLLNLANTAPLLYSNSYITIHDLAFYHHPEWNSKKFSAWYNILIPRLALRSRHIFTVSETIKSEIIKCYQLPPAKISVTYNGISQGMLDRLKTLRPAKEKIILAVGTFNRRKNHQSLVAAYLASKIKDEYELVVIGDKNRVFSESGFDQRSIEGSNIKIYSTVSELEMIDLYQKAEIVVSLSLYEGFGIPLLEGLYNGCKIVCSDIPVYRELYDGYVRFCDPEDIKSVSNALEETTATENKMTQSGVGPLLEKYSYRQAAEVILSVLRK